MVKDLKGEFMERFGWLIGPVGAFVKRVDAFRRSPDTQLAKLWNDAERKLDARAMAVGKEAVGNDLSGAWIPDEAWAEIESGLPKDLAARRAKLRRRPVGRAIVALIDRAHASVRCSPMTAVPNPVVFGRAAVLGRGAIEEAVRTRGEVRARALARVVADIAENIHRPHLQRLWTLEYWAAGKALVGKAPPSPPKFGRLVDLLRSNAMVGPHLVEIRAAHVRNAVDHDHFRYAPSLKALKMHDANGWHDTLSARTLRSMANRMLVLDDAYWEAISDFGMRVVWLPLVPFFREFAAGVRENDLGRIKKANEDFGVFWQDLFGELGRLDPRYLSPRLPAPARRPP
jgi:hypothetical protein